MTPIILKPLCPICLKPFSDSGYSSEGVTCPNPDCGSTFYLGHLETTELKMFAWESTQAHIRIQMARQWGGGVGSN